MPNPTYTPSELAPEVIKVGDKLHTALDEISEDNGIFSDISTALQQKTGQVDPYDKEDIADAIDDLQLGIPIDPDSDTPLALVVDSNGFRFSDTPGEESNVAFGKNQNGIYVAADSPEQPQPSDVYVAEKAQLQEQAQNLSSYNARLAAVGNTLSGLSDLASRKETLVITPTTSQQTIYPRQGYSAIAGAIVEPVTAEIDSDIQPENIRQGVDILGVMGTLKPILEPIKEKDVNFYDYDGTTLLYSYTVAEILALTELPIPLVDHSDIGIQFYQWNWSLASIKSYMTDYPSIKLSVAAEYSGLWNEDRLYIDVDNPATTTCALNFSCSGTVTIDWGDGTIGNNVLTHTYSPINFPSEYTIKITASEDIHWGEIPSSNTVIIKRLYSGIGYFLRKAFQKCHTLKSVIFSNSIYEQEVFVECYSLESCILLKSVTAVYGNCFVQCNSLKSIVFPRGITLLYGYSVYQCSAIKKYILPDTITQLNDGSINSLQSLETIIIPSSVTNIGSYSFQQLPSITSIIIPSSVTRIGNYSFSTCPELSIVDLSNVPIPPIIAERAFYNNRAGRKFAFKDQAQLDIYAAATNWSSYANDFIIKTW